MIFTHQFKLTFVIFIALFFVACGGGTSEFDEPEIGEANDPYNYIASVGGQDISISGSEFRVRTDNCGASVSARETLARSRSFNISLEADIATSLGGELEGGVLVAGAKVQTAIETSLGIQIGTTETVDAERTLETPANSISIITLQWEEVWSTGNVNITDDTGDLKGEVPFRVLTTLRLSQKSVEEVPCSVELTPIVTKTATITPIPPTTTDGSPSVTPTIVPSTEPTAEPTSLPTPTISSTPSPVSSNNEFAFELNLENYGIGDIPNDIGSDLVIGERDGRKLVSGLNDAGQLNLDALQLSSNFEAIMEVDWTDTNAIISMRSSDGSEIRINFDDGISFGNTSSSYSSSVGWKSGSGINLLRLTANKGAVRLFINDDFFGSVPIRTESQYGNFTITGITQEDSLFSFEIRDTTNEILAQDQSTSIINGGANNFNLDFTTLNLGDIPFELGNELVIDERDGRRFIAGLTNAGRIELSDLNISQDFEMEFVVDWNETNAVILLRTTDGREIKVAFADNIKFGNTESSYSSSVGWKSGSGINTCKLVANKEAVRFFINNTFFGTVPLESPATFSSIIISGIQRDDALFSFGVQDTSNLNIVQDGSGVNGNENLSDFFVDLNVYSIGDIPRDLGDNLVVGSEEGQKIISGLTDEASITITDIHLKDNFDIFLDVDWNDANAMFTLISQNGDSLTIDFTDKISFGNTSSSYSSSVGWKSGSAVNSLRLTVGEGAARFFINEEFFDSVPVNDGTIFSSLFIDGITRQDAIYVLRADSY